MDQSLTSAHGTAPPNANTRCITLGTIPRYAELYRKSGRPPRVNVMKSWRFDRIDLSTRERCVLKLSDGRTYILKPGTNRFDPPLQLEAGAWFVIHMAVKVSGRRRPPLEPLSGWVNEDDVFDSLLAPDDPSEQDKAAVTEGTVTDEELAPLELRTFDEGAEPATLPPAPVEHRIVSTNSPALTPSLTFTFGRSQRTEGLFARLRRKVFFRAAA